MNFFGFNQTEVLPYSQSKYAAKDEKVQKGIAEFNESLRNKKYIEESTNAINQSLEFEKIAKNVASTKSIQRRQRCKEDVKLAENLTIKALSTYLAEMTMNGLVFDDYFIEDQKQLKPSLVSYIEGMFNKDIINKDSFIKSDNILLREAYDEIYNLVKEVIKNRDSINIFSEDTIYAILSEAPRSKNLSDEVSDTVKEKVTDTIKDEKRASKKKEEDKKDIEDELEDAADSLDNDDATKSNDDKESSDDETNLKDTEDNDSSENNMKITIETDDKKVSIDTNKSESVEFLNIFGSSRYKERNSKSLFRNMLESNIMNMAKASSSNKINMDMVLAESITEYTLLETLLTSKVISLSNSEMQSILKTINFNRK